MHLDAELVALDESGRPAFWATGTKRRRHCLTCFDILWLNGENVRALTLGDRRQQLAEALAGSASVLHLLSNSRMRWGCYGPLRSTVSRASSPSGSTAPIGRDRAAAG